MDFSENPLTRPAIKSFSNLSQKFRFDFMIDLRPNVVTLLAVNCCWRVVSSGFESMHAHTTEDRRNVLAQIFQRDCPIEISSD